jgi:hypothetical protein
LLLLSTCSRVSLKTDAFAYNNSPLIQIPVEESLMPVTTLDSKTALIVVDLQKGIISSTFIHPVAGVIEQTCALLDAFRQRDLPVVLVNVAGGARPNGAGAPFLDPPRGIQRSDPGARSSGQRYRGDEADMGRVCEYGSRGATESQRGNAGCCHRCGNLNRRRSHCPTGV